MSIWRSTRRTCARYSRERWTGSAPERNTGGFPGAWGFWHWIGRYGEGVAGRAAGGEGSMALVIDPVGVESLSEYATISIAFEVESVLAVEPAGFGGIGDCCCGDRELPVITRITIHVALAPRRARWIGRGAL